MSCQQVVKPQQIFLTVWELIFPWFVLGSWWVEVESQLKVHKSDILPSVILWFAINKKPQTQLLQMCSVFCGKVE